MNSRQRERDNAVRRNTRRPSEYQARHSRAQAPTSQSQRRSHARQTSMHEERRLAEGRPQRQSGRPPQRRRRSNGPVIAVVVVLLIAVVLGVVLYLTTCSGKRDQEVQQEQATQNDQGQAAQDDAQNADDSGGENADDENDNQQAVAADSWELTLVNEDHALPEDWDIELAEVQDGKYVDARIAEQFRAMVDDCRAAGFDDVYVNQAYRSHEDQQAIWDEFYANNLAAGYSEEEAYEVTAQSVAVPGHSEHELGLAADICSAYFDETYNAPIQTWLSENGHKYGFIQRYPAGKEDITGVKNENWHFRYVGVEAATAMYESDQVLEEYLGEV